MPCHCEEEEVDLDVLVFQNKKIHGHYGAVSYVQVRDKLNLKYNSLLKVR